MLFSVGASEGVAAAEQVNLPHEEEEEVEGVGEGVGEGKQVESEVVQGDFVVKESDESYDDFLADDLEGHLDNALNPRWGSGSDC